MPKLVHKFPSYRCHKASGQAVVTLDGRDIYLGAHGTRSSKAEYDRVIAEWLAHGRRTPAPPDGRLSPTVGELILRYWLFAKQHYQRDGRPTRELDNIRDALRPVRDLYGHTLAADFGPVALKAVRRAMIEAGLARTTINFRISKMRRVFKWAAENELLGPGVYQGLMTVAGLRSGREGVRETSPIKPVPEAHVEAVLPHVSAPVRAMIQLQALTGMRPGEVAAMRVCDIERSGDVWVYTPTGHKTQHHGHDRRVPLGPQAQELLRPWLAVAHSEFLFSPAAAVATRNESRRARRKTPTTPSQTRRRPKLRPKRAPRDRYDKNAYGQAIARVCKKAGVPHWHPSQLRHNAATQVRQRYGIESARQLLGHRSAAVTEVYAEADAARAAQIMREIG